MIWKPENDGYDHINIYSRSDTALGRAMSNFFRWNFFHPEYGEFQSIEGFYYWLLTGGNHYELRYLFGFKAKKFGMEQEKVRRIDSKFKEEVQYAIYLKVVQCPYIQELLLESVNKDLPFAHYYYYGDKHYNPAIRDRSKRDSWLIDAAEKVRIKLKQNGGIIQ